MCCIMMVLMVARDLSAGATGERERGENIKYICMLIDCLQQKMRGSTQHAIAATQPPRERSTYTYSAC